MPLQYLFVSFRKAIYHALKRVNERNPTIISADSKFRQQSIKRRCFALGNCRRRSFKQLRRALKLQCPGVGLNQGLIWLRITQMVANR